MAKKSSDKYDINEAKIQNFIRSQKDLQDFINLASTMRKRREFKDMNFFKHFFLNADKFI